MRHEEDGCDVWKRKAFWHHWGCPGMRPNHVSVCYLDPQGRQPDSYNLRELSREARRTVLVSNPNTARNAIFKDETLTQ
ncbi:hypothetical protein SAMN05443245_7572 [Paraburkholderia fungorum]|uniref:Uncharacterized protein n=1 Tax=Paraburkholderia fungorum TaxID=134537 RepID=A0A1H1JYH1_9BURK|nr:hypothetical protein SAMN05443245_7572 [Paraburkholderia fungorum]